MSLRVVKLGGSLLDWPELARQLRGWLALQSPAATVLIVGGGSLADEIRRAQQVHDFDDAVAHRLCLEVMAVTARLVCELLPEATLCSCPSELDRDVSAGLQICDVREFLVADAGELPESWQVTSDSIAAHLAGVLGAGELVLLKSTIPSADASVAELAKQGVVDEYFPQAAQTFLATGAVRMRLVNLRDERFAELAISGNSDQRLVLKN
jgi:5-(aminomethyl)-3-furanmethanol phosphate kinase